MPTETQHLEQRVAALQSDLNARDQALDDAATENNERELSRRSWFDEAQRLQAQLAERDALLRDTGTCLKSIVRELKGFHDDNPGKWCGYLDDALGAAAWQRDKVDTALSASTEPIAAPSLVECDACPRSSGCENTCMKAPVGAEAVKRDERAEFEQAFVVQEGVFFSKERNEYRSINGRSIEHTDAIDLNLRLQGWKARGALDCPDCGDTGVEPCSKHGWKP